MTEKSKYIVDSPDVFFGNKIRANLELKEDLKIYSVALWDKYFIIKYSINNCQKEFNGKIKKNGLCKTY